MNTNKLMSVTDKPLAFFDLETTGVSVATDRIVEISIVKVFPDGSRETLTKRVNPTIPILPEATAVHGITNEDVANEPTFSEIAREVSMFLVGCDMAGYNIMRFDLPMIVEEMLRAGAKHFPREGARFIDAMSIFHHFEKRDLTAALKFYCNKELEDAHSAEADTLATVDVLSAQIDRYGLSSDVSELQEISLQGKEIIDYAGKFTRDEKGDIVFTFGKNKGKRVVDDPSYVEWMCRGEFTGDTKDKGMGILRGEIK